jgi:hypothetical protein
LATLTSWWTVIVIHIAVIVYLLIYKGDAIFGRGRHAEKLDKDESDGECYRAAREERDAYDDFIASQDMDND